MQAEDIQRLIQQQTVAETVAPKAAAIERVLNDIKQQADNLAKQIDYCDAVELQQMLERTTHVLDKLTQCGTTD
jgi:hypothetical protein